MKIEGQPSFTGNGEILSGYYSWALAGSSRPKLFELSDAFFGIENFIPPYDAVLFNPNRSTEGTYTAVGNKIRSANQAIRANVSGAFYYHDAPELIGTCHGFGRNDLTYYSGYNFYNAFYPAGYFQPPFGETTSLFKLNLDEYENLNQGACFQMNVTEYNEHFGIISKVAPDAGLATDTLTPNSLAQIMSLKETCPEGTVAVTTYYEEVQAKRIPGTASSISAPTLYNHNATPTSLDNYDNWVDSRYKYVVDTPNKVNKIQFGDDLRPISNYPSGDSNHSKLNNSLCYAQLFETDTSIGRLTNGLQRIETPDTLYGSAGSQVSAAGQEPWHYWHFLYRENAEMMPFSNYFKQIRPGITHRTISEGTQLFTPILSSEDAYWQNRQCPDTVDFLPWNFGASIYACPSEHFDIPYYAAIKKFGFYGVRFLNTCSKLNLENAWSGVDNALEVASQSEPLDLPIPDAEPEGIDLDGNSSFTAYDDLLRTAKTEERFSNVYALNKGFFLWANTGCITGDSSWGTVSSYDGFTDAFWQFVNKFQNAYEDGLSSITGEVVLTSQEDASNSSSDLLFTNLAYEDFSRQIKNIITGVGTEAWKRIEDNYSYYVSDCKGAINEPFYQNMISGREKRIRTRYFENIVMGNPVDLFPMNHITFTSDEARTYLESTGWARVPYSFGKGSKLPPIQRRYFEGAYGNESSISGFSKVIDSLSMIKDSSFYPGFFNTYNFGKELPSPHYVPILSGYIRDNQGRRYSPSGWLAVGYNEVGALDKNFSCFTPILTQQPLDKTFCKIGQRPTLRVTAVDYHSIPEDKISFRYPEIVYWAHKLKIVNDNLENNYPLQYVWFRVDKSLYGNFAASSNFSLAEFADPIGKWCALEGENKSTCTIIHPNECVPVYSSELGADDYTFIQGVEKDIDDNYYYFCMVMGRFGIRISEPAEIVIEDWVKFDISYKGGMNFEGEISVDFIVNDKDGINNVISFKADPSQPYQGYQRDKTAIPECVVEQKIPPPNAGFGDVSASRFIGMHGYVGATRSYAPDTLKDTRGLREAWGRFLDYGSLIQLSKRLSQKEGNLLYGYQHLPRCENYSMAYGRKGIRVEAKVNDYLVTHWTLAQKAFASVDNTYGMQWNKIGGIGCLYPPAMNNYDINSPYMGIGHWQWGTNLGSIKRFGKFSTTSSNDIVFLGRSISPSAPPQRELIKEIQDYFITPSSLAGSNCGYTPYGLGRNMLYYIEAYDRFYLICDPVKKKNVANKSFMCPGLRNTNSAIQYFWLGQPSNTYVERRPMFGPYAYQWRVRRHNRDRNGNGISQGFYSMGYNTRYELMYDAPAIYGLYVKRGPSSSYLSAVNRIKALRNKVLTYYTIPELRTWWFGERGSDGTSKSYGDFSFSCDPAAPAYNSDMCEYVSAAKDLANNLDFRAYSCPSDRLLKGECFDPCLSIRYSHGFFPGGKSQSMFNYTDETSLNLKTPKNLRLVPMANLRNESIIKTDEQSSIDKNVFFRSPINTPHARISRGLQKVEDRLLTKTQTIVGISPCKDGGSDHCNYLTATLHLDSTNALISKASCFVGSEGFAANIFQLYDSRISD